MTGSNGNHYGFRQAQDVMDTLPPSVGERERADQQAGRSGGIDGLKGSFPNLFSSNPSAGLYMFAAQTPRGGGGGLSGGIQGGGVETGGVRGIGIATRPPSIGNLFRRAGIEISNHAANRIWGRGGRGVTEKGALDAYNNGRVYYDPANKTYIRYDSKTGISVAVSEPSGGTVITVFEGPPSPRWNPVRFRK
jgi:hypothetical protein